MLESDVHYQLRGFLRQKQQPIWEHYLTMARLVSRTLRLRRSALIQTGNRPSCYSYSYLTPALLSDQPLLLVIPLHRQKSLCDQEIPQLQEWLGTNKEIILSDRWINGSDFRGLLLTSPESWLKDRLNQEGRFPVDIPTLIDQGEDLAEWTKQLLTLSLTLQDWERFSENYPTFIPEIREIRVKLTKSLFNHPPNPYDCYLLEQDDLSILEEAKEILGNNSHLIPFFQELQSRERLYWSQIQRTTGYFTLYSRPIDVSSLLTPIWSQQPIVLIGSFLDAEKEANLYKNTIGLKNQEILCLKFSPSRQNESINLYLPDKLPLPNTPEFQGVLTQEIDYLLTLYQSIDQPIVILIEDVPLQGQIGSSLAGQWGSRVQVNRLSSANNTILVCGWEFWHQIADEFPTPQLLIMATLPIPSLENPLVAGQVAYYKQKRQDWFRSYLLPTALRNMQQSVIPLRENQGLVAILDNRVNSRSYGSMVLDALAPYAKLNYLERNFQYQ